MATKYRVQGPDGSIHVFEGPDNATPAQVESFAAQTFSTPIALSTNGIPGPRQGTFANIGTGLASLADTTIGGVLPMIGQGVQAVARPFTTPKQAEQIGGAVTSAIDKPFGKAFGVTEQPAYKQEASRQLIDFIGQNVGKGADWLSSKTGLPVEDVRNMLSTSLLAAPAIVKGTTPVVENALVAAKPIAQNALATARATSLGQAIEAPIAVRAAKIQEANVAKSYAAAPIIDAAQAANRTGLAVNPAITNPTMGNKAKNMVVGSAFDEAAAKANAVQTTNLVRKDLGVAPDQPLNAAAVETALDNASKPYDVVRNMDSLTTPKESIEALQALKKQPVIGGETKTSSINSLVDDALQKLQKTTTGTFSGVGGGPVQVGRSGAMVLNDIRSMRRDAQAVYKAQSVNPDPLAIAKADTQMAIANILEGVIDANAPTPEVLSGMQAARTRMAQIYDHDRAINFANGTVDPQVYAKLLEERKGNMTGVGADIGKVAATFPEVMTAQTPSAQSMPRVARSGISAAAGALAGGAIGGYPGAIAGASLGGAVGWTGTQLAAKNMVSPAYQAARAMPTDYRPAPNMLRPAEINMDRTNALVPYDYSQSVVMPNETPNFIFGRPEAQVNVSTAYAPNQLPAPSAEGTLGALAAERARAAGMSRTLGQQAEAQQAAAEAAGRQPTGRGSVLEFDPITGTYKVGGAGVKGATPEVFMSNTGASLNSAAQKMASNQPFSMTAAEKVAWEKTKVDLATAAPEFKALSAKELSNKMQDRQWVSDTIEKIREKAQAFDEISKRASTAQAIRDAAMKREQMMDLLADMEDQLRASRPVQKGGQGPKTRAFQRNQLTPEQEIQNALAK